VLQLENAFVKPVSAIKTTVNYVRDTRSLEQCAHSFSPFPLFWTIFHAHRNDWLCYPNNLMPMSQ